MDVERFNAADGGAVRAALGACLDVPRWVEEVAAGRPYPDAGAVLAAAARAADPLTDHEVERALSHHPRLGERPASGGASAEMSRREQGAMSSPAAGSGGSGRPAAGGAGGAGDAGGADDVAGRLRAGNAAYEERFGHVFLLRAAGRGATEVLEILERRLGRTPEQERATTAEQLREIALLRLEGVLAP